MYILLGDAVKWIFPLLMATAIPTINTYPHYKLIIGNDNNCHSLFCYPDTRGLYFMGWPRSSHFALQNNSLAPDYEKLLIM